MRASVRRNTLCGLKSVLGLAGGLDLAGEDNNNNNNNNTIIIIIIITIIQ